MAISVLKRKKVTFQLPHTELKSPAAKRRKTEVHGPKRSSRCPRCGEGVQFHKKIIYNRDTLKLLEKTKPVYVIVYKDEFEKLMKKYNINTSIMSESDQNTGKLQEEDVKKQKNQIISDAFWPEELRKFVKRHFTKYGIAEETVKRYCRDKKITIETLTSHINLFFELRKYGVNPDNIAKIFFEREKQLSTLCAASISRFFVSIKTYLSRCEESKKPQKRALVTEVKCQNDKVEEKVDIQEAKKAKITSASKTTTTASKVNENVDQTDLKHSSSPVQTNTDSEKSIVKPSVVKTLEELISDYDHIDIDRPSEDAGYETDYENQFLDDLSQMKFYPEDDARSILSLDFDTGEIGPDGADTLPQYPSDLLSVISETDYLVNDVLFDDTEIPSKHSAPYQSPVKPDTSFEDDLMKDDTLEFIEKNGLINYLIEPEEFGEEIDSDCIYPVWEELIKETFPMGLNSLAIRS